MLKDKGRETSGVFAAENGGYGGLLFEFSDGIDDSFDCLRGKEEACFALNDSFLGTALVVGKNRRAAGLSLKGDKSKVLMGRKNQGFGGSIKTP